MSHYYRRYPTGDMSCILDDFLYVGNFKTGKDWQSLARVGITHVLNCATEWTHRVPKDCPVRYYQSLGLRDVPSESVSRAFQQAFAILETVRAKGERILVHCMAGVSRAPTIVIAYLMAHHGMTLKQAYVHVKSRRQIVNPNQGFRLQLIALEAHLNPTMLFATMQPQDWEKRYTRNKQ